ncbi:MAG: DUF933 domain-containing protein, partial [Patescibacteria group bacterium]
SKEIKRGDKNSLKEEALLKKVIAVLENGLFARMVPLDEEEYKIIKQLNLLTMKPFLYGLNKKADPPAPPESAQAGGKNLDETDTARYQELLAYLKENNAQYIVIDAKIEDELKDFEGAEKETFRKELGGKDDGISNLIVGSYSLLGLQTFFTTGEDETRGWTIKKGVTAPEAGTAIHNDFKEKFIRAEVVFWKDLLNAGSYAEARTKGLVRTEGKKYVVKDGDVIEFKI